MPSQSMENLELNIQIHTIYGTVSMMKQSANYRYKMLSESLEHLKTLNAKLYDAIEVSPDYEIEPIFNAISSLGRSLNKYEELYAEALTKSNMFEDRVSEIYKNIMNDDYDLNEFNNEFENINKILSDEVLCEEFINYYKQFEELEELLMKISNKNIQSSLAASLQQSSNQLYIVIQQNEVIASSINLIDQVSAEVN
ncbi:MAG: hypothetical protein L0I93_06610 [Atopostipes suicloacalis]|nr:hypothetical protein [Atopostipes suicloacalis]